MKVGDKAKRIIGSETEVTVMAVQDRIFAYQISPYGSIYWAPQHEPNVIRPKAVPGRIYQGDVHQGGENYLYVGLEDGTVALLWADAPRDITRERFQHLEEVK